MILGPFTIYLCFIKLASCLVNTSLKGFQLERKLIRIMKNSSSNCNGALLQAKIRKERDAVDLDSKQPKQNELQTGALCLYSCKTSGKL